jgi:glucosyl-3-phosphoglycerate synthase
MGSGMSLDPTDLPDITTSDASEWPLDLLLELKGSTRIAVVIPARNEGPTVANVVSDILRDLDSLVDDLIVIDSLSTDDTARVAVAAGARVHSVAEIRPDLGIRAGKGEAIWKSQFVTDADLIAFIDADLTDWGTHFVLGVLGPLLADPRVQLCRGFYDRLLDQGGDVTLEGGRVTELVARPWLALFRPELVSMIQPLAGEWAIRSSALNNLSIPTGYGVEMSTLLGVHSRYGLEAIAQVDLGRRAHMHQNMHDLAAMSAEILAVADRRRGEWAADGIQSFDGTIASAVTTRRVDASREWADRIVSTDERPPFSLVRD